MPSSRSKKPGVRAASVDVLVVAPRQAREMARLLAGLARRDDEHVH